MELLVRPDRLVLKGQRDLLDRLGLQGLLAPREIEESKGFPGLLAIGENLARLAHADQWGPLDRLGLLDLLGLLGLLGLRVIEASKVRPELAAPRDLPDLKALQVSQYLQTFWLSYKYCPPNLADLVK